MARVRFHGVPGFKRAEIRAGAVGRMPQHIGAPLEGMNLCMEIENWAFYGLREAGCGFAPHPKASGWKSGVTSFKSSAPVPLAQLDPTLQGCSHSALALGGLSPRFPRILEQGCGKGSGDVALVPPPSPSSHSQSGLRAAPFIP